MRIRSRYIRTNTGDHNWNDHSDDDWDAMYSERLVMQSIESVVTKNSCLRKSSSRCFWILLSLLLPVILLSVFVAGKATEESYDNVFRSSLDTVKRNLEIIQIKRVFHFPLISAPSETRGIDSSELSRLDSKISSLNDRQTIVETSLRNYETSWRSRGDLEMEIQKLYTRLEEFDRKLDQLESQRSSDTTDQDLNVLKAEMSNLRNIVSTTHEERDKWHQTLTEAAAKNAKMEIEAMEIRTRLESMENRDVVANPSETSQVDTVAVNKLIATAISKYDADKTGMSDFALESAGGSVLGIRCTKTRSSTRRESIFGIPLWYKEYSPRTVIQAGFAPGECWAFEGSHGYLIIKLSGVIRVTGVSYEHIPRSVSPAGNIDSAPKVFEVHALSKPTDEEGLRLGVFKYHNNGSALQYFPVQVTDAPPTEIVEFRFLSNHGHPVYTCLYRIRVHGERLEPAYGKNSG